MRVRVLFDYHYHYLSNANRKRQLVKQQIKNQYGVKMKKQYVIVITKINGETGIQTLIDNRLIYTAIRCSRILNGKKVNITRNNQTNLLKGEYQWKSSN